MTIAESMRFLLFRAPACGRAQGLHNAHTMTFSPLPSSPVPACTAYPQRSPFLQLLSLFRLAGYASTDVHIRSE